MRSSVARNTAYNLLGQALPLLVGLLTIPATINLLGKEKFGILSLALVLLTYFGIFDLGLGRATVSMLAGLLERDHERSAPALLRTSISLQAVLGVLAALVLAALAPTIITRFLAVPDHLQAESRSLLFFLATSLPFILISLSLRGALEASQRFDLVNAVKSPSLALLFLIPYIGAELGLGLPGIGLMILLTQILGMLIYLALCQRFVVNVLGSSRSSEFVRPLMSFGGWLTVSNVVSPFLMYIDRLILGTLTLALVTYYVAPQEVVVRLWIVPGSLAAALFPAISALYANGTLDQVRFVLAKALNSLLLLIVPIIVLTLIQADLILDLWLGPVFASESSDAMRILCAGMLFNCLAFVPLTALQGTGSARVPALSHLVQLPIYIFVCWFLIEALGLEGAALAWTLRAGIDAGILFFVCHRVRLVTLKDLARARLGWSLLTTAIFSAAVLLTALPSSNLILELSLQCLLCIIYLVSVLPPLIRETRWVHLLTPRGTLASRKRSSKD